MLLHELVRQIQQMSRKQAAYSRHPLVRTPSKGEVNASTPKVEIDSNPVEEGESREEGDEGLTCCMRKAVMIPW